MTPQQITGLAIAGLCIIALCIIEFAEDRTPRL